MRILSKWIRTFAMSHDHSSESFVRVADLDRLLAQLNAAGIAVEQREDYDYGRFAWIRDPENNRIELYQPL
jgi:predicted enzyme related to lactoylglutathione lyase